MAEGGSNIQSRNNYPDRMQQSQQGFFLKEKKNIFYFIAQKNIFL